MTKFFIKEKEYGMTVNLGTLTFAEMFNEGVSEKHTNRLNLGFALACFYGADRNCGLQIEDLIDTFDTAKKYNELMAAVKAETDAFSGANIEEEDPKSQDTKKV